MDATTFEYLKPTEEQLHDMALLRTAFRSLATAIEQTAADSRYRSLALTALEESAMWTMKAVTREGDGTPRP